MPIVIRHLDIEYICTNAADAAELGRLLAEGKARRPGRSVDQDTGDGPDLALRFLLALRSAKPAGLSSARLSQELGLQSPKGIGPLTQHLNRTGSRTNAGGTDPAGGRCQSPSLISPATARRCRPPRTPRSPPAR